MNANRSESAFTQDALSAELSERRSQLDELAKDETGAKREHIFHKDLAGIIKRAVKFTDGTATLRDDAENMHIMTLTAISLPIVNTEFGHIAGDKYLKDVIEHSRKSFQYVKESDPKASFEIFRRSNQDFTGLVFSDSAELFAMKLQDSVDSIAGADLKKSVSYIKMAEVVEVYNQLFKQYEIKSDQPNYEHLQLKILGEVLLKMSEYKREFKKLEDLGSEFLNMEFAPTAEQKEYFNKYVVTSFKGSAFANLEHFYNTDGISKPKILEFINVCHELASDRTLGETETIVTYFDVILEKYAHELSQNHISFKHNHHETTPPTQSFVEFSEKYQTKEHQKIQLAKESLEQMEQLVESNLNKLKEIVNPNEDLKKVSVDNTESAEYIANQMAKFVDQLDYLNANGFPIGDQLLAARTRIVDQKLTNPAAVSNSLTAGKGLKIYEDLIKIKMAVEIEKTEFNIRLCTVDAMTGLKNKTAYENRLQEIHKAGNEESQIIASDLAFLKYFNSEAGRATGDTAIHAAAYILEQLENNFSGVEVYRIGGDETAMIVAGDENRVTEVINFIHTTASITGPIPDSGNSLGKYIPEEIQFNLGYCLKNEAEMALELLLDPSVDVLSNVDKMRLDKNSDQFDFDFYANQIAKVQNIIADLEIEDQKIYSRVVRLAEIYKSNNREHFYTLYPYSGKGLAGLDINVLEQILQSDPNLTDEEIVAKVHGAIDQNLGLNNHRLRIIDKLIQSYAKTKMVNEYVQKNAVKVVE